MHTPKEEVTVYPYRSLGHARFGWLNAKYHFSFAGYDNPERTGFGSLLVINDDTISAHRGFDTHPHHNMEIITYVKQGVLTHTDTLGNTGDIMAGEVQIMSAGSGIMHSEKNTTDQDVKLYQIWIKPNKKNTLPRWETRNFASVLLKSGFHVLVSGQPEHTKTEALLMQADAAVYGGKLMANTTFTQQIKHQAYILASKGTFTVNGYHLQEGDGAEVIHTKDITFQAITDSEILIIDVPSLPSAS